MAIAYEEIEGSPEVSVSQRGVTGTRKLVCNWDDRYALAKELLGITQVAINQTILGAPQTLPDVPFCFADDVKITKWSGPVSRGQRDGQTRYDQALLTVSYRTYEYDVNPQPGGTEAYASESMNGSAEFLNLPIGELKWQDGSSLKQTEVPGKIVKMMSWAYTKNRTPTIPKELFAIIGKVNKEKIRSPIHGVVFEPETLLMGFPTINRDIRLDGARIFSLTLNTTWKPDGWNKFYRDGKEDPEYIYKGGSIYRPYKLADFSGVLPRGT